MFIIVYIYILLYLKLNYNVKYQYLNISVCKGSNVYDACKASQILLIYCVVHIHYYITHYEVLLECISICFKINCYIFTRN